MPGTSSSASWASTTATPDRPPMAAADPDGWSPIHSSSSRSLPVKGRRTRRHKLLQSLREPSSPTPPPPATPPPSSTLPPLPAGKVEKTNDNASPASSSTTTTTTTRLDPSVVDEDDQDLALCLMLLAQGRTDPSLSRGHYDDSMADGVVTAPPAADQPIRKRRRRRPSAVLLSATEEAAGAFQDGVYECKTCGKRFHSFQALGGHRTSHKKPKVELAVSQAAVAPLQLLVPDNVSTSSSSSPIHLPVRNNNSSRPSRGGIGPRAHECSICGAEFSSGQALGGHMRRHRPLTGVAAAHADEVSSASAVDESALVTVHKDNNVDSQASFLDLNLPAPLEVDDRSHNNNKGLLLTGLPMGVTIAMGSGASASTATASGLGLFPVVAGKHSPPEGVCLPLLS